MNCMNSKKPAEYRKKPVVVEAMRFDGSVESANHVLAWIGGNGCDAQRVHPRRPELGLSLLTLEGTMTATPGDYIIRGVQGEFYPCKPEIFEATYDKVHK